MSGEPKNPSKPVVVTRVAHAGHDSQRYRGWDLFRDLLPSPLSQLLVLGITGRRISADVAALVDDIILCVAVADPRIWPMKIARLASSYGSDVAGLAAPFFAMAEARLGPAPFGPAARGLVELADRVGFEPTDEALRDALADAFESKRFPPGFGVPFRARDERSDGLESSLRRHGRWDGPYVRLYRRIVEQVRAKKWPEPNITLISAAAFLDAGFAVHEIVPIMHVAAIPSFQANAVEESQLRSPALRCLPLDWIEDRSPPLRRTKPPRSP